MSEEFREDLLRTVVSDVQGLVAPMFERAMRSESMWTRPEMEARSGGNVGVGLLAIAQCRLTVLEQYVRQLPALSAEERRLLDQAKDELASWAMELAHIEY